MTRKVSLLASLAALALAGPAAVAANELSYTYFELGYVKSEIDDADVDGDGFGVHGSYAFTERFHGFVEYSDVGYDFDVDGTQLRLGGGLNWDLSPRTDIIATVSYVKAEVDANVPGLGSISVDDDGIAVGAMLRAMLSEQFELNGGLDFVSFDEGGDDTVFGVGARYYMTKTFALGGNVSFDDGGTTFILGARFDFSR